MAVTFAEIGRRAAKRRSAMGLSQEDVAKAMGVSRQVYGKIENGRKAVNAVELQKLHEVLQIPLDELLREEPQSLTVMFMGKANSPSAKDAVKLIARLAKEYVWQSKIAKGEQPC